VVNDTTGAFVRADRIEKRYKVSIIVERSRSVDLNEVRLLWETFAEYKPTFSGYRKRKVAFIQQNLGKGNVPFI
jgi:hypothetical protein